jgi:hypothetical protein
MAEMALLSPAAYARHRKAAGLPGGSREAVSKAIEEGRISTIGGKIHAALADDEWARNTRARQSPQASGASGASGQQPLVEGSSPAVDPPASVPAAPSDYTAARTRREQAEAETAEIELRRKKGELVLREDVDRAFFEMFREVRDRLAATAKRTAAEVSSLTSAEACETVIEREHKIVLELLTQSFREKVGAPPRAAS